MGPIHGRRQRRCGIALCASAALTLGACESPTEPSPFPDVSGTFEIEVEFRSIPTNLARASGTLVLEQTDRQSGELNGSADVVVVILAPAVRITEVVEPSVTERGRISFGLPPENPTSAWEFSGSISPDGSRLGGIHVLSGAEGGMLSGIWRAVRR